MEVLKRNISQHSATFGKTTENARGGQSGATGIPAQAGIQNGGAGFPLSRE